MKISLGMATVIIVGIVLGVGGASILTLVVSGLVVGLFVAAIEHYFG